MTPDQREAAPALVHHAAQPAPDRTDFVRRTGITEPSTWALLGLRRGIERRSADDVDLAVIVAAVFGEDERFVDPLIELLLTDWHVKHEDAAHTLGFLGSEAAVPALVQAAHHVPAYLDDDEARPLAVKAIHALGRIPGAAARQALHDLLEHEDRPLRPRVQRVLERRAAERD